jgi:hypothetical protein
MTAEDRAILAGPTKRLFCLAAALFGCLALVIAVYLAALFIMQEGNPDFLNIDSCLDSGGKWNYRTRVCEH